jgi:hypothetical protein
MKKICKNCGKDIKTLQITEFQEGLFPHDINGNPCDLDCEDLCPESYNPRDCLLL